MAPLCVIGSLRPDNTSTVSPLHQPDGRMLQIAILAELLDIPHNSKQLSKLIARVQFAGCITITLERWLPSSPYQHIPRKHFTIQNIPNSHCKCSNICHQLKSKMILGKENLPQFCVQMFTLERNCSESNLSRNDSVEQLLLSNFPFERGAIEGLGFDRHGSNKP